MILFEILSFNFFLFISQFRELSSLSVVNRLQLMSHSIELCNHKDANFSWEYFVASFNEFLISDHSAELMHLQLSATA